MATPPGAGMVESWNLDLARFPQGGLKVALYGIFKIHNKYLFFFFF
jgi:hypothetical protein